MNTAILRRGLASGWKGLLVTSLTVAAMLAFALAVYRNFDLSIYNKLPEAARALLGIPLHADPAMLAYNEMLASIGALAFVGIAIAVGAQAIAGEEQDHTLSLLLSAPVSRITYILSRAAALVLLLAAAGALLWGVAVIMPRILSTDVGEAHLFALVAHLTAGAIFHASLALAVGAATGRKGLAAGVAATVMIFGWIGSSLLPIWRKSAADWVPWFWFNGSQPLVNGVDVGQLALLLGGAVVLVTLGAVCFHFREIRLTQLGPSFIEQLRKLPGFDKILAPTEKGSSLLGLRLAAGQVMVGYVAIIMGLFMGLTMPLLYKALSKVMGDFAQSFPQTLSDLFGGGNLGTPAGFLHLETFGMMGPAAVILVATIGASSGIAGEERARRMSLLLAQPISRARVYWTVAATTAIYVLIVTTVLFLGTWAGLAISGVAISLERLAAACVLLTLLGFFFGALALLISAGTGRSRATSWGTTGVALMSFFGYTLLLAAGKERWGWWSPFRAYLHGPPLEAGFDWWQPTWLLIGAVVFASIGLPLFQRRDLKISAV